VAGGGGVAVVVVVVVADGTYADADFHFDATLSPIN
jgi:hypothetical protein